MPKASAMPGINWQGMGMVVPDRQFFSTAGRAIRFMRRLYKADQGQAIRVGMHRAYIAPDAPGQLAHADRPGTT